MTPLERLYAEELPTGTFGDAQPPTSPSRPASRPWTAQEQYEHRQTLAEALDGWDWHDTYTEARRQRERQRHLRAINPAA